MLVEVHLFQIEPFCSHSEVIDLFGGRHTGALMSLYNTWNPLGLSLSEIGLDFYFESHMLSQILAFEHDREFWPIAWMPRLIHAYFFFFTSFVCVLIRG